MTPEQVMRALIAGVTERRWDDLPQLYAPDTVVEHPMLLPEPGRLEGRAALARHFDAARRLPLRMRAENVVLHPGADPELIVGEFDYVAEHTSSGATTRIANVFVLRVRDGQIVHSRDYSDHARFARLGIHEDAVHD